MAIKKTTETKIIYSLAGLVGLSAFGLLIWFGYGYFAGRPSPSAIVELPKVDEECEFRRVLDGVCVEKPEDQNPKLMAVMFDNHLQARPQSGLASASVVYEAPVEGNYTRFMGIYPATAQIEKVGPVRSVRPYYLDWLSEYGTAMYFHVGGSPDALALIKERQVNDFNEFYSGQYFWRDFGRSAPHNVYTSSENWQKALEKNEDQYVRDDYDGWKFGKVEQCTLECTTEIDIVFLPDSFDIQWQYNTSTKKYERFQHGIRHKDHDGKWIVADSLIIQKVETEVLDGIGRLGMETVGSGEAVIFVQGNRTVGSWKKDDVDSRTRWFDSNNEEITLPAGVVWVEVANQNTSFDWR